MFEIGYTLSSEEHGPLELVEHARRAERAGFSLALVSDHFHPWIDRQGHSPFVWGTIGGVALATEHLRLGTGVTCPIKRIHPTIIAQAAATAAAMMPGRFFLGVGSGENLNEHVVGGWWPSADVRQEMLEEAVEIIRTLWQGGQQSYFGEYFDVEDARIYTLPEELPPIVVAAGGGSSARLAARVGDGMVATKPDVDLIRTFEEAGGSGKPTYGQVHVCWAPTEAEALRTALESWPNASIPGELGQELPLPRHFEQTAALVGEEAIGKTIPCGPDPERHLQAIREFADAGFDHVYVHQVGPNQEGFSRFYEREVIPKLG